MVLFYLWVVLDLFGSSGSSLISFVLGCFVFYVLFFSSSLWLCGWPLESYTFHATSLVFFVYFASSFVVALFILCLFISWCVTCLFLMASFLGKVVAKLVMLEKSCEGKVVKGL